MALQKEVWIKDIQEVLFDQDQAWINRFVDHSEHVVNKTVHIPQAGAPAGVEKNRSTLPATAAQRTDSEVTYVIDSYTTDPIAVTDFENAQISYDKRMSVMKQHYDVLGDRAAEELLNTIAVGGNGLVSGRNFRTTGADDALLPHATATGKRLRITQDDIINLANKMDRDKVSKGGRTLLLPHDMITDLFKAEELMDYDKMRQASSLPEGYITRVMGFDILDRSFVVMFDEAANAAKKAVGSAEAATDCLGAIAWQSDTVSKALGSIKIFDDVDSPTWYGTILSAEVLFGGSRMRSDDKGVWTLAQGYVAP